MMTGEAINHLRETEKNIDNNDDDSIPTVERQYRKILRLTVEAMRLGSMQVTAQSTEANLQKLLSYRPSSEDMKLILEPMCYLSKSRTKLIKYGESLQRDRYLITLQQDLIEYFLDKYSASAHYLRELKMKELHNRII